ncbi:hypothetical protein Anapl_04592 [Anas platyrhynchos]|uniref:Uncharacterized protein n=1 Tax=Anas platyrhynchos TaxID=8839 RepID=R0K6N4_ANAPL|nr:hypothetical protein Anapl_04592 [Anas platyrhynchos]
MQWQDPGPRGCGNDLADHVVFVQPALPPPDYRDGFKAASPLKQQFKPPQCQKRRRACDRLRRHFSTLLTKIQHWETDTTQMEKEISCLHQLTQYKPPPLPKLFATPRATITPARALPLLTRSINTLTGTEGFAVGEPAQNCSARLPVMIYVSKKAQQPQPPPPSKDCPKQKQ